MPIGTISDLDNVGQYGLIDADDGRVLPFNLRCVAQPQRQQFTVGARVAFADQVTVDCARALILTLLACSNDLHC